MVSNLRVSSERTELSPPTENESLAIFELPETPVVIKVETRVAHGGLRRRIRSAAYAKSQALRYQRSNDWRVRERTLNGRHLIFGRLILYRLIFYPLTLRRLTFHRLTFYRLISGLAILYAMTATCRPIRSSSSKLRYKSSKSLVVTDEAED